MGAPAGARPRARNASTRPVARLFNLSGRLPALQSRGTRFHAWLYRRSGGRLGNRWLGVPVLVIETVGRRSGKLRASPIVYVRAEDGYLVAPANAGADRTPAWWLNLKAAGEATAVVRGRRERVRPRVLTGAEREQAWAELARVLPAVEDYRDFTEREFPLVLLEKAGRKVPAATESERA